MAMIPTLKMFATTVSTDPAYLEPIYAEVREFHRRGGTLLFGTDVGYMTDYSIEGELEGLARCGLDYRDVLAMLTTAPAERMGASSVSGSLSPGKRADLTILSADPSQSLRNFATVQAVVRSGKVLWQIANGAEGGGG
jgi:imidazolonepropionase-like amidohydrolase